MQIFASRQSQDVFSNLSPAVSQCVKSATEKARQYNSPYVDPEHLLMALVESPEVFSLVEASGVDAKKLQDDLFSKSQRGEFSGEPEFSSKTRKVFEEAKRLSEGEKAQFISFYHIIASFFQHDDWFATQTLKENGIDLAKLQKAQKDLDSKKSSELSENEKAVQEEAKVKELANGGTSVLETYTIDLTQKARDGKLDPVVERDAEIERVMEILTRRTKNNPALIGDAGVGKTAIVEGLAQKIASGQIPDPLKDKKLLVLDLSLMIAGAKHRGEFEERLEHLIKEVKLSAGGVILFIDELHTIIGAGGDGSMDAANILKPALARGELQCIGATTIKEFRQYIEKDAAFERRFQKVSVEEPTAEQAIKMLAGIVPKYEQHHSVKVQPNAIEAAVRLSQRYIADRSLPDKAIDVIDEACAKVVLNNIQPREVSEDIVKDIVSALSGIPITKLTQDESKVLLELENLIHKRLIDQEPAVKAVSEAIRRNRAGLKNPKRPVGSFIFLGPTGVGKTQLAKTLAEVMFGVEDKMIRIDMSEYMEKNATARMIGAPPGYVGYEEGGQLTEAVRKNPYSVILFDEIEKANQDVFNIFLQILDEGRLTDSKGRTVDFKNTIIICTSNVGTQLIKGSNISDPNLQKQMMEELLRFFRPEFVNRFDDIIIFRGLMPQDMEAIVAVMISEVSKLLAEQKITLELSAPAKTKMAQIGFDPVFGARPLRRMIQKMIENPLSSALIRGEVKSGQNILVDLDQSGQFRFAASGQAKITNQDKPMDKPVESTGMVAPVQQPTDQNQQPPEAPTQGPPQAMAAGE